MPDHRPLTTLRAALLWAGLAGVLSLAAAATAAWVLAGRVDATARALAKDAADRFEQAFNLRPEIRVDGLVVIEGTTPTLEIATARKDLLVRYKWSNTYLYSTKEIEIEAPFRAAAGFKLDGPFRISLDPRTKSFSASLPRAELLSFEMGDPRILRDEDGLWNKLTPADREDAFRTLRRLAEQQIRDSNLIPEATRLAEERLEKSLLPPSTRPLPPP